MEEKIDLVEFVGDITLKDIEDGTVLIFRISRRNYPQHVLRELTDSIAKAVADTFDGKVKAIILPDSVDVTILKDLLKERVDDTSN